MRRKNEAPEKLPIKKVFVQSSTRDARGGLLLSNFVLFHAVAVDFGFEAFKGLKKVIFENP